MSWQEELSKGIRTAEQLAEYMGWDLPYWDSMEELLVPCLQQVSRVMDARLDSDL